jgi:NCS2 family nucleobase:cation symporter-2
MRKPSNIIYGVDERPPLGVLLASGLQHVGLLSIYLVYPILIARAGGLSEAKVLHVVSFSLLALGIAAIIPALKRGGFGAGVLSPALFSAAYATPSLLAVKAGGLALVYGMTIFAGLVEMAFGKVQHRLRPFFPPEIAGLVVILIAVSSGKLGARLVLGIDGGVIDERYYAVAAITLATMIAFSVWAKGGLKMFCALLGMAVGYLATIALGKFPPHDLERVVNAPFLDVPSIDHIGWSFDAALMVPFAIAAIAASFKTVGVVTTYQRANDADWVRPDMRQIGRGVVADGAGSVVAGLLGTPGINSSPGAVGLATATGVTSRVVAFALGAIFLVLAFLPKAAAIIAVMPRPVMGAVLLFSASFVLLNGIEIVASRLLDSRRTFVVGLSFLAGLAVEVYPQPFAGLPHAVEPLVSSSLVLGLIVALLLNLIFRIGVWRVGRLRVDPAHVDYPKLMEFIEAQGAAWGARRDVIERARFNVAQSVETIIESASPDGALEIEASFDEFRVDIAVRYSGAPLDLPETRPTEDEILDAEDGHRRLAGYLLRRSADRVRASHRAGRSTIVFHFDH